MPRTALLVLLCAGLAACSTRYSDLPMTPTQSMAQAEDALHRGEYANAVSGFSDYLATGDTTFRARAFFELAQAQYGLENYEAALDTLQDLEEQYPREKWPQIPALRGDIEYALGKRTDAIRQWDIAWQRGDNNDRQFLRARIEEAIDELTPAQTADLAGELQSDDVRAMLAGHAPAAVAAVQGRPTDAAARSAPPPPALSAPPPPLSAPPPASPPEPVAAPPPRAEVPPPAGESADEIEAKSLATLPPSTLDIGACDALDASARVAAVLPLTGPDRAYGQRALTGLRLAFAGFPHMLM